jgi:hypothetical protein
MNGALVEENKEALAQAISLLLKDPEYAAS